MMTMKHEELSKKAEEILNKPYARRLVPDETGGYVASIQEFPGCVAEGDTPEAAIQSLNKAAASWVQVALANGYEIRDPVSFHGYSGKIALRIPRGLHKQVAELAELEGSSINQLLVTAIAQHLGSKRAFREMAETILSDLRQVMSDGLVSFYRDSQSTLLIAFPTVGKSHYIRGKTIERQVVAERRFNLGSTYAITNKQPLGALQ